MAGPRGGFALLEELEQGAAVPVRMLVGLVEVAGTPAPVSEAHLAVVGHGRVAGDQAEEVALAGPVRPEHGHPLAVPDLGVEGIGQAVQRQPLDHERLATGASAAEADVDPLFLHELRGSGPLLEVPEAGLGRLQLGREAVGDLGPLPHHTDELDQPGPLVLPFRGVAGEAVVPGVPSLVVGGEAAAVGPGALGLDGADLGGDGGQQLTVVADEEDGLGAPAQLVLEPALRDVQEVVGLVEEQDGGVAPEQRLERQPLLLSARAGGHRSRADRLVRLAQHLGRDRVPEDLELVAADLGPVADRLGVGHGGAGVVGLGEVVGLGLGQPGVDPLRGDGRERRQQLVDRRAVADRADELGHDGHAAVHGDGAVCSRQLAADDAQEGGLPGAVDADEGDVVTVADVERRVLEQGVAARPGPAQVADLE